MTRKAALITILAGVIAKGKQGFDNIVSVEAETTTLLQVSLETKTIPKEAITFVRVLHNGKEVAKVSWDEAIKILNEK